MRPSPIADMNTASVWNESAYWIWIEVNRSAVTARPNRGWRAPRKSTSSQIPGRRASAMIPGPPSWPDGAEADSSSGRPEDDDAGVEPTPRPQAEVARDEGRQAGEVHRPV